jgi:hypothetical protein
MAIARTNEISVVEINCEESNIFLLQLPNNLFAESGV